MNQEMPSLVDLEQVEVRYGKTKALDRVTCSIGSGAVGLLGPNGAGKSTLLRTILGFVRADRGRVRVFGYEMPRRRKEVRRHLGYMPERSVVSPKISGVSFLTYCGCLCGMSRADAMERAHEVLNSAGVGENRYRKMETYSTGMCQRLKFAQALVHNPKLLLLDEPTNGLDPEGRVEMLELIRDVADRCDITILLSSHLMPDVYHVCSRVIVLKGGCVVREGNIADLTAARDGLFEVRVRDRAASFRRALEAVGCQCQERQNGNTVVTTPKGFDASAFFEIARNQGTQVRYMKPVRKSLEEAFMEAIGNGTPEKLEERKP